MKTKNVPAATSTSFFFATLFTGYFFIRLSGEEGLQNYLQYLTAAVDAAILVFLGVSSTLPDRQ